MTDLLRTELVNQLEAEVRPLIDEALAYVRRGVESGTIEGEVGRVEGASVMSQEHTELLVWVSRDVAREIVRGGVDVLVIPVSDGGEDRP